MSGAEGSEASFYDTSFVNANLSRAEMYQCGFDG
ncbi:MAG: pentapeptide repeat-containing protein [Scytonematopsis contorta HA4267-MV1]|nr:pentapeptide repeat-containing protein [Scytonematopsis contorta HA4267-MV1]